MEHTTVAVKVSKKKVSQLKKLVDEAGLGEVMAPDRGVAKKSNIVMAKRRAKKEKASEILARVGKGEILYSDANELRKAAWSRSGEK